VPPTRRYPNFVAFIATGAILGFVVGSAVAYLSDDSTSYGHDYSVTRAVLFLGVVGALVCALLAAVVAVLLDRSR
jgi:threonine/homoserine/homoserine lactone efflux protein